MNWCANTPPKSWQNNRKRPRKSTLDTANFYAQQMAELTPALSGAAPQTAYAIIQLEIDNVRQAWQQAIRQLDLTSLNQLLEPLYHFFARQGWFVEGKERLATAVTAIQSANLTSRTAVRLLANLQARQGALIGRIGQYAPAEAALRQGKTLARQAADPHILAFALIEFGRLLRDSIPL